jgi:hypothetical protein
MGDRGTITFTDSTDKNIARIYTHWYGSEVKNLLVEFFDDEIDKSKIIRNGRSYYDLRWNDPSYLAVRFLHWVVINPSLYTGLGWGIFPTDNAAFLQDTNWVVKCANDELPVITQL